MNQTHLLKKRQVHEKGGKIAMQILHSGRYGYHPWLVSPSAIKAPIGWFKPDPLSSSAVEKTIEDYAKSAALAKKAGYDGVEIMGSEGYLINQFIASRTNKRDDEWGGDYANRIEFPRRIVKAVREATGEDFIIIYRLSMLDLVDNGSDWSEIVDLAQAVEQSGASIINTGIGWHEARIPTIATSVPRAAFSFVTAKLRLGRSLEPHEHISRAESSSSTTTTTTEHTDAINGAVQIPLVATNRINDPLTAERVLASGHADMVSMARPLLADPQWILKAERDEAHKINTCIACNQACLDHTFLAKRASCLVNPRAGYETDPDLDPSNKTNNKQRVAVVGAGPAGLACATTAAERGHDVTLFDASDKIGGQFNMAKRIPGKEEFYETLRYFENKIQDTGVNLALNRYVSEKDLGKDSFDTVVLATGVTPRELKIPGSDHPNVVSYLDVLSKDVPVGSRVAIVGSGGIGFDVCEYISHNASDNASTDSLDFLSKWGVDTSLESRGGLDVLEAKTVPPSEMNPREKIYMLQRKTEKHGKGLGRTTGWIHRASAKRAGVEFLGGVKYDEVDENGHLHIRVKDKKSVLDVDTIIVCAGQESLYDLEAPLKSQGVNVHRIGGAAYAGELDAKRAIDMGTRLGVRIESLNPEETMKLGPPVTLSERFIGMAMGMKG